AWSQKVTVKPDGDREMVQVPALAPAKLAPGTPATREPLQAPTREPVSRFSTQRKIALAVAGSGVVALGAGTVLILQAKSLPADARQLCPSGQPCHDLTASQKSDQAVSRANLATVIGVVGLTALSAGVLLWVAGGPPSEGPFVTRVVPTATPDSAGL